MIIVYDTASGDSTRAGVGVYPFGAVDVYPRIGYGICGCNFPTARSWSYRIWGAFRAEFWTVPDRHLGTSQLAKRALGIRSSVAAETAFPKP